MFFFLSKTLDLALSPLTWALVLGLLGSALAVFRPARRLAWRGCWALGLVVLYGFSTYPVSNALQGYLESSARTTMKEGAPYDGVVLLGGMVQVLVSQPEGPRSYNDNSDRLIAAFDVLRKGQAKEALLSGGGDGVFVLEARVLKAQLVDWGIAPERLIVDDQSRNTRDNAVASARVAKERGWKSVLIITSAFHMDRALGCYRAVGLEVDALPVDWRAYDSRRFSAGLLPRADALAQSTQALRELSGRLIYRIQGYSAR